MTLTSNDARTDLLTLLRSMMVIRGFENQVLRLRREDLISGSVHVCVGQEVVPVVVCAELDERDRVLSTYRGHGWALGRGVPAFEVMSEILGRTSGTNSGRAGSAYLTAPEYGFVGENSIVGAGAPIANGVAMGLVAGGEAGIAVVSFGDGATNQGAVHEALVFAIARQLPVLFVCENNSWSEMTPIADTVPRAGLASRAGAYGMHAERVDGSDIPALQATVRRVVQQLRDGDGPAFLEVSVPRILGHYNGDIEHYRSDADRQDHADRDPLASLTNSLIGDGTLTPAALQTLEAEVAAAIEDVVRDALASPYPDPSTATDHVTAPPDGAPVTVPSDTEPEIAYGLAVNRALRTELEHRPDVVTFGEDIAIPGGTFGVTRNLRRQFGERAFDTPIAEASILGAALGASLTGLRPIVEIMWTDFLFVAFDQIVNQMSNVRYLSEGRVSAPLVVRMQQGITPGSCAQHSQSLEALITHIPGIKVGMPSNAQDAYAMLRAAVADPDPVVLIESRALYLNASPVAVEGPIEAAFGARRSRSGMDVLLISWGRMVNECLAAAQLLSAEGIEATVLDLRWLAPLDLDTIADALRDCQGKVVIVHEANVSSGFGAEVAARLVADHLEDLDGPVHRVGLPDVRVPSSPTLQEALMPSPSRIAEAARRAVGY